MLFQDLRTEEYPDTQLGICPATVSIHFYIHRGLELVIYLMTLSQLQWLCSIDVKVLCELLKIELLKIT
jgi:hypothetical protein